MTTTKVLYQDAGGIKLSGTIINGSSLSSPIATIVYDVDANTVDRKRLWNTELGDARAIYRYLINADGQTGDKEIYLPPAGTGADQAVVGHTIFIKNTGTLAFNIKNDAGTLMTALDPSQYTNLLVGADFTSWVALNERPKFTRIRRVEFGRAPFFNRSPVIFKTAFDTTPIVTTDINARIPSGWSVTNAFIKQPTTTTVVTPSQFTPTNAAIVPVAVTGMAGIDTVTTGSEFGLTSIYREFTHKRRQGTQAQQYGIRYYLNLTDSTRSALYLFTNEGISFTRLLAEMAIPPVRQSVSSHIIESHNSISDGPLLVTLGTNLSNLRINKGLNDRTHPTWYDHVIGPSIHHTMAVTPIDLPDGNGPGDDMIGAYAGFIYVQSTVNLRYRYINSFDGSTIGSAVNIWTGATRVIVQGLIAHSDYTLYALFSNTIGSFDDNVMIAASSDNGTTWSTPMVINNQYVWISNQSRNLRMIIRNERIYIFGVDLFGTDIIYTVSSSMDIGTMTWSSPVGLHSMLRPGIGLEVYGNYIDIKYLQETDRYALVYYTQANTVFVSYSTDLVTWTAGSVVDSGLTGIEIPSSMELFENNYGEVCVLRRTNEANPQTRITICSGVVEYNAYEVFVE